MVPRSDHTMYDLVSTVEQQARNELTVVCLAYQSGFYQLVLHIASPVGRTAVGQ